MNNGLGSFVLVVVVVVPEGVDEDEGNIASFISLNMLPNKPNNEVFVEPPLFVVDNWSVSVGPDGTDDGYMLFGLGGTGGADGALGQSYR
jgi:hypothetical protein